MSGGYQIWTEYDAQSPPPLTSPHHVRFVLISDTHSTQPKGIPDGDILLHSGDLTALGDEKELAEQLRWLKSLPHPHKVVIAGNHDFCLDDKSGWYTTKGHAIHKKFGYESSDPRRAEAIVTDSHQHDTGLLHYLESSSVSISVDRDEVRHRVWKLYGSPWTPEFGGWAWNYPRGDNAKAIYADIPADTDILLTHGPPHKLGGLDTIHDGSSVGCEELTRKGRDAELRPRLWAVGHIHEGRGVHEEVWSRPGAVASKGSDTDSTLIVNAAMVDFDMETFRQQQRLEYIVKHQAIIVDLEVDDPCVRESAL